MKVVVTGGAGFLGQHVVAELRNRGCDVLVFDRHQAASYDVCSPTEVEWALKDASVVVHLAGVLGTEELFDSPDRAVQINVQGTLNVLQAARKYGVEYVGITMPDVWRNVYQATKHCAMRLAQAWHDAYDMPVAHVRAFNAYGVGQKVFGVQKIVPTFSTRAWRDQPLPIWGDGSQTVDLISATQIARVFADVVLHVRKHDVVLDAGTGEARTVLDVAGLVATATEKSLCVDWLPMRLGEKPTEIVASGEGWHHLNWRPTFDKDEFLETVHWYKEDRL